MILWRPVKKRAILMAFSFASAPVGKEKGVDVARRDFSELRAEPGAHFGRHEGIGVRESLNLLFNGGDETFVTVSDVDGHELAVEIDVALAFGSVEVNSLGASDGNGVDF